MGCQKERTFFDENCAEKRTVTGDFFGVKGSTPYIYVVGGNNREGERTLSPVRLLVHALCAP